MESGQLERRLQPLSTILLSSVGTSSLSATFTSAQDINAPFVTVTNGAAVLAYMGIGSAAIVNTGTPQTNSTPIPGSSTQTFYKGNAATITFITSASTTSIMVTAVKGG